MAERIYLRKFEGGKWRTGSVSSEASAAQMVDAGWQPVSKETVDDIKRARDASGLAGTATAAIDAATVIGLGTMAQTELFGRDPKQVAAEREAAGTAGDVAAVIGAVAPIALSGGAGALGGAARLAPSARLAASGARVAKGVEGALGSGRAAKLVGAGAGAAYETAAYGAGAMLTERALGGPEITGERLLQGVGTSAGIGMLLGVAGRGVSMGAPAAARAVERGVEVAREAGAGVAGTAASMVLGPKAGLAARALLRRGPSEAEQIAAHQTDIAGLRKLISSTNDDIARLDIDTDLLGTKVTEATERAGRLRAGADIAGKQADLSARAGLAEARGATLRERGSVGDIDAGLDAARREVREFQAWDAEQRAAKYGELLEGAEMPPPPKAAPARSLSPADEARAAELEAEAGRLLFNEGDSAAAESLMAEVRAIRGSAPATTAASEPAVGFVPASSRSTRTAAEAAPAPAAVDDAAQARMSIEEAQRRMRFYEAKATIFRGEAEKIGVGKSAARAELLKKAEQADLRASQFREKLGGLADDASYAQTRASVADAQAAKLRAQISANEAKQAKYFDSLTKYADDIRAREADIVRLTDRQIFKTRARSIAADVAESLATAGRRALPVAVARPAHRQEDLLAIRDRVNEMAADPVKLADHLRDDDLYSVAPEATRARTITASRAIAYLKSIEPATYRPPFSGGIELVDSFALDDYEQRVQAVVDPLGTLRHGLKTGTLTVNQVQAVQAVYPKQLEKIRADLLEKLGAAEKAGQAVETATRVRMSIVLGIPLDRSLQPDVYGMIQQSISFQATANRPPPPSKNPGRPAKSGDDGRTATQSQRREGRAI